MLEELNLKEVIIDKLYTILEVRIKGDLSLLVVYLCEEEKGSYYDTLMLVNKHKNTLSNYYIINKKECV